jgi:RNA polymerase sigma factor (sigma-70 family)
MLRPTACFARLLKLLQRRGRSQEDAEDLIQEALLRLHEYCRSRPVRDEEAFLVHCVKNLSIDRHRRERRHLYANQSVEDMEATLALTDSAPAPDEVFDSQQRLERIRSTLDAVSTRTREIYFAHRAGYSYAEIAEHLRISPSAIEKHIARAVLALMDVRPGE